MKVLLTKKAEYISEENRMGKRNYYEFPSQIFLAAAYLEKQGFDVEVINKFPGDRIDYGLYQVVVAWISLLDGLYDGLEDLRVAKEAGCNTVMVLNDPYGESESQIVEEYPFVDYAVRMYDREIILGDLLHHLERGTVDNLGSMQGLVFRGDRQVVDTGRHPQAPTLDHLVSAAHLIREQDFSPYTAFFVRASRGCPFRCTYCHIGGRKARFRRIKDVISEMEALPQGVQVKLASADLFHNKKWIAEFCDTLLARQSPYAWETDARADSCLDEGLLRKAKEAGCEELAMGAESFDEGILEATNKKISLDVLYRSVDLMLKVGITPYLNMMIGHPLDSHETIGKTMEGILALPAEVIVTVQIARPFAGTEMYNQFREMGLLKRELTFRDFVVSRTDAICPTRYLTREEVNEWFERINLSCAVWNHKSRLKKSGLTGIGSYSIGSYAQKVKRVWEYVRDGRADVLWKALVSR